MQFSDTKMLKFLIELNKKSLLNIDDKYLSACGGHWNGETIAANIPFPLDAAVEKQLQALLPSDESSDDEFYLYNHQETISTIWIDLLTRAIICLRFFDDREPFIKGREKQPIAYGIEDLESYYNEYTNFEDMLYGSNKFYRDHVIHVFRVWLMGMVLLTKDSCRYMEDFSIGESDSELEVNYLEIISIWTIISLTHDLGYPLEKSQRIIDRTQKMMKSFITNPMLSMDLSFSGVQNIINDYVLRFISSKMTNEVASQNEDKPFAARLQPKYYFKFQKSLEKYSHGIISAIIDYKLLTYFLESDFSINEDYYFGKEDVRQFYIRREILRTIASHTCSDIYHMSMCSLSFLLILVDECQEWGRKRFAELYVPSKQKYGLLSVELNVDSNKVKNTQCKIVKDYECVLKEQFIIEDGSVDALESVLQQLYRQSKYFVTIFRDGQDTQNRNFDFKKETMVQVNDGAKNHDYKIELEIGRRSRSMFTVTIDNPINGRAGAYDAQKIGEVLTKNRKGIITEAPYTTDGKVKCTIMM